MVLLKFLAFCFRQALCFANSCRVPHLKYTSIYKLKSQNLKTTFERKLKWNALIEN